MFQFEEKQFTGGIEKKEHFIASMVAVFAQCGVKQTEHVAVFH